MENEKDFLVSSFKSIGYELNNIQIKQFMRYYELLVEKNKVMNLTAITEYRDVVIKHFVDSVLSAKLIDIHRNMSMIDVGTGAGFPGIPLKILYPNLFVALLDSLNKRVKFLEEVIEDLKLCDIALIHGRAEDVAKEKVHRESYDLCVSRAVANLSTLSEYCIPFIKIGGSFISYKSSNSDEEIKNAEHAIKKLGCETEWIKNLDIPGADIERTFVCIKKIEKTPRKYPRRAGTPSKEPL